MENNLEEKEKENVVYYLTIKGREQPQIENQPSSFQDISTLEVLHVYGEHMDHPSPCI